TREAKIVRKVPCKGGLGAEGEEIGRVDDLASLPVLDHRDMDRILEELAGMEQPDRKRLPLKKGAVGPIADLDMLLEIDALEKRLGPRRLGHVRDGSTLLCLGRQQVEIEGLRIAHPHAGKRRCSKPCLAA